MVKSQRNSITIGNRKKAPHAQKHGVQSLLNYLRDGQVVIVFRLTLIGLLIAGVQREFQDFQWMGCTCACTSGASHSIVNPNESH